MSSEWRAGSDEEEEEEEEEEEQAQTVAKPPWKRLSKLAAAQADDEAEYSGGGGGSGKKQTASERKRASGGGGDDNLSVSARVSQWVEAAESSLGVVGSFSPSTQVGRGLTPDLATQPWCIAGATMHPHQMAALNWIKARFEMGANAILADEMGLG